MTSLRVFGPPVLSHNTPRTDIADCSHEASIARLLIGDSAPMHALRDCILRVGRTSLPVLIQGETGVGKELVAQALHIASGRGGPFVAFNVCAIGETMFEDALFGHVRGAFTGALSDAPGYLLEAHGGTAFFDEIGGLSGGMQAKLLRAIETKSFRPVGGRADKASDFRVVCATNEDVAALVKAGRFRSDLSFRVSAMVLRVPPLRERVSDIPELVRHFALRARAGSDGTFTESALGAFADHTWAGNVRELRNSVELLVGVADGAHIEWQEVRRHLDRGTRDPGLAAPEHLERLRLRESLERADWSVADAAGILGVHPATLYRRMQRLGVVVKASQS